MLKLTGVLGNVNRDLRLREQYERLSVQGKLERVLIEVRETQKSRLRKVTDKGTEVGIVLERGQTLQDGDLLYMVEPDRAIVVDVKPEDVMAITLDPAPTRGELIANAVRLGHVLGNQHWPLRVEGETVYVPISIDPNVMETVMKAYHVQGIHYEFKQAQVGAIPPATHAASTEHPDQHA